MVSLHKRAAFVHLSVLAKSRPTGGFSLVGYSHKLSALKPYDVDF